MPDFDNTNDLSRTEREWLRRRQDILQAASRLFARLGFAGTTMQAVSEEAEYSVGYIYKHFPAKSDLLDAIIDDQLKIYEVFRDEIRRDLKDRPVEALREQLRRMCRQLQESSDLMELFISYEASCPDRIRPRVLRYRYEDAEYFRTAIRMGLIKPCDPDLIAAAMEGANWGLFRQYIEKGWMDRADEIPELVDTLLLKPLLIESNDDERKEETTP